MLPTLRQLEYIVMLADTGQFVETAKQCRVSQPALSKQVREVEEMMGVVLFERARPRLLVTPAGEEIIRRARRVLAEAQELVKTAQTWKEPRQGLVRLGVIPTIAPYGLPGLLTKLRKLYPMASFCVCERQTEVLLEQLRVGRLDLGLLARSFDDEGLDGRDFVTEPFVLVAPEEHSLSQHEEVRAAELAGESLLLMEDGHCLRDQAIEVCTRAGPPLQTSVEAASVSTLIRLVESGLGATLVPASALSAEVRPGHGLVARSFAQPAPGRTLTLQWRASSPKSAWFIELTEIVQQHYLDLNASIPEVFGQRPAMAACGPN